MSAEDGARFFSYDFLRLDSPRDAEVGLKR
jgi:hypothetical protein